MPAPMGEVVGVWVLGWWVIVPVSFTPPIHLGGSGVEDVAAGGSGLGAVWVGLCLIRGYCSISAGRVPGYKPLVSGGIALLSHGIWCLP